MGSSPVRVTSKKDRQNAYPFLLFGNPYGKNDEPIGFGKSLIFFERSESPVRVTFFACIKLWA